MAREVWRQGWLVAGDGLAGYLERTDGSEGPFEEDGEEERGDGSCERDGTVGKVIARERVGRDGREV